MGYIYVSGYDIESAEASYICGHSDLPDRINGVPMSAIVGPGTYTVDDHGEYVKVN